MKKLISILLASVMLLGLCACGGNGGDEAQAAPAFRVGFGRVDITPQPNTGLEMGGYDNQISQGVLSYIYATCVAITDTEDNTLLLYTLDITDMYKDASDTLRAKLTDATGIPGENITLSCTHTHSAPKKDWLVSAVDKLAEAAHQALADRAPATAKIGNYDVPNMNWDRHYILNDGSMKGDNFGDDSAGYQKQYSEADKTMRLIRFVREGDKKDVLMVNWQVHPKLTSTADTTEGMATRNLFSSDFVGYARDYVEAEEDVLMAYYNGASGNVNPFSKIPDERGLVSKDGKVYGKQFGEHVVSALADMKDVQTGAVAAKTAPLGEPGGYELHAYTVGSSLGFATVPAEIFHQTGTQIREGSPCEMTFVITCANGRNTYIPIDAVWDYKVTNGDIPYEVRICKYPRGTAESLAKDLGAMLTELAGK